MTIAAPQLRVTVQDEEIIVTLPGYFYSVRYHKPQGSQTQRPGGSEFQKIVGTTRVWVPS